MTASEAELQEIESKTGNSARFQKGPSKNRQRAFHSAKDYETSASQLGPVISPDANERTKARKIAAEQLVLLEPDANADDLTDLLMMLGIHPKQPEWNDGPQTSPGRIPKGM